MARGSSQATAARRRAREAERKASAAKDRAHRAELSVPADADLDGSVAQCAEDARKAHERCGGHVRKCDEAARVPSYADRFERRDAAEDVGRHARAAEQAAEAAELAADGAEWAAKRAQATEAELQSFGASAGATLAGWMRRSS